jgi:hypothetical protein
MFGVDDKIGDVNAPDGPADMSLTGPVLRQANIAGVKRFGRPAASAHIDLQFPGQNDPELVDDTGMPVHLVVLPIQHPESRKRPGAAPLVLWEENNSGNSVK